MPGEALGALAFGFEGAGCFGFAGGGDVGVAAGGHGYWLRRGQEGGEQLKWWKRRRWSDCRWIVWAAMGVPDSDQCAGLVKSASG